MEAAMLGDECAAVDADDVVVGEGFRELALRLEVRVGIPVGGHQDGSVRDEEVRVCGGQSGAIFVVRGLCHREWDEAVRFALQRSELLELGFHLRQFGMVFVVLVEAFDVGNRVVGTESGKRVDVAVRVVAREVAVVEPKDALGMEGCEQSRLDLFFCQGLVAMWREQAFACRQDGSLPVALDASSLEHEVEVVFVASLQDALLHHSAVDSVVELGRELLAPSVESEVEQARAVGGEQGDEAVVASPSIVRRRLAEGDAGEFPRGHDLLQLQADMRGFGRHYNKMYARDNRLRHLRIATAHILQDGVPIGVRVRPSQLHGTLFVPFCGQEDFSVRHRRIYSMRVQSYE